MLYKDFKILPAKGMPHHYEISFDGRGKVANQLTGLFTSVGIAKEAINRYLKLGSHAKTATEG